MHSPAQRLPNADRHAIDCLWFWAWAAAGAVGALGMVSLGPIALGPALIAAGALSTSQAARRSPLGMLAGAGLVFLFVAYLQQKGREPRVGTQRPPRDAIST